MPSASRVGELLVGKYRLEKLLGSGGVGEVYRAQNTLIGRTVAIKVLRPEHVTDPNLVARFIREARAANLARHRNVVDVLDVGKDQGGIPFIVQEMLEGIDLGRRLREAGTGLAIREVLQVMIPVVEAVGLAHARGVIHRDLKPENVFLAREGSTIVPKLLDFGISYIQPTAGEVRMTKTGVTVGTPAYMSPEQLEGTEALDARTDVWALGVILYELLSGRLPFEGESQALLFAQIAWIDPAPLLEKAPHVGEDLAMVVHRCLQRNLAQRYPTASEVARDLNHVRASRPIEPTHRRSVPVGAERSPMSSAADGAAPPAAPPSSRAHRAKERPHDVLPVASPIEPATGGGVSSGLRLATLRPPRPAESVTPEEPADGEDAWLGSAAKMASFSAAPVLELALLMLFVRSPEGFPVGEWLESLTGGSAPAMHKVTAIASLAGSVWLFMRLLRSSPRLWGLAGAALGLALVGVSLASGAFLERDASARAMFDATSMAPLGLMLAALGVAAATGQRGWDSWQEAGTRAKITGVVFALLTGTGLFAAEQLARAIGK